MTDQLRLAELLCVRFAHDLSGLLGSLAGVLELVEEAQPAATEEVVLARDTVAELVRRLQFLRAAWGGTGEMDLATLRTRLQNDGTARFRVNLDGVPAEAPLSAGMARVVLNVILLAKEALPKGGELFLSGDPTTNLMARIVGSGAAWPAELAACIGDAKRAAAAIGSPRALQAPLTVLIARAENVGMSLMLPTGAVGGAGPSPLLLTARQSGG